MNESGESSRYLRSCKSEFWQKVFAAELDYILKHLQRGDEILSVGCGPAIIEGGLSDHGFTLVGLDVSQEALAGVPDAIRAIAAPAEEMPFPDASFDVVIYIASLQFIENYREALSRTAQVLRPGGKLIVVLLNPASEFFKGKLAEADSYVRKIRHTDLQELESAIAELFDVQSEYFLGIANNKVFTSQDPMTAALYVIRGIRKESLRSIR